MTKSILVTFKTSGVLDNKLGFNVNWKYIMVTKKVMHKLHFKEKVYFEKT